MAREAYLVQQDDGTMATVQAFSIDGAKREYLRTFKPKRGGVFSVKLRGGDDAWRHYNVI